MRSADPSLAAIAHKNARWLRLVMTTCCDVSKQYPSASTPQVDRAAREAHTQKMPQVSYGKAAAGDLSYNRGKIPRAARDFYEWRIRAGAASGPWATSKQTRLVRTPKMRRDPSGQKASLRMTGVMNSGDDGHSENAQRVRGGRTRIFRFRGRSAGRAA